MKDHDYIIAGGGSAGCVLASRLSEDNVLFRNGPAASSPFVTGGFATVDETAASPDMQLHLGFGSGIEAGIARLRNACVTLNSASMRPRSRGRVRLACADPAAALLIDPDYWTDGPRDVFTLAQARARDHDEAGAETLRAGRTRAGFICELGGQ